MKTDVNQLSMVMAGSHNAFRNANLKCKQEQKKKKLKNNEKRNKKKEV